MAWIPQYQGEAYGSSLYALKQNTVKLDLSYTISPSKVAPLCYDVEVHKIFITGTDTNLVLRSSLCLAYLT